MNLSEINWNEYPPVSSEAAHLVVKIGNQERRGDALTYLIRDLLKASNYQFQSTSKTWAKIFPIDGFNIEIINADVWAKSADGIEVHILDEIDRLVAHFLINAGSWLSRW